MRITFLCLAGLCAACSFPNSQRVRIYGEIPIPEKARVELLNAFNGVLEATCMMEEGSFNLQVDSIDAGIYILAFYWPKTFVSQKERISRIKAGVRAGSPEHVLQKSLYVSSPGELLISLNEGITTNDLETYLLNKDPRLFVQVSSDCTETQFFEQTEQLANDYRISYFLARDSLKQLMYEPKISAARYTEIHQEIGHLWLEKLKPELEQAHMALMQQFLDSPVTPCLIYQKVQGTGGFGAYRKLYESMGNTAKASPCAAALRRHAALHP